MYITYGIKSYNENILFISSIFKPINFKIYKLNIKYNFTNKNNCIEIYDQNNIKEIKEKKLNKNYRFFELYKKNSIKDSIYGARLYYLLKSQKSVIVCDGYFEDDPLNIFINSCELKSKYNDFKQKINKINLDNSFKNEYLNQIFIKDFILYDNNQLIKNCLNDYDYLSKLKNPKYINNC